jgi:hypothetical protein
MKTQLHHLLLPKAGLLLLLLGSCASPKVTYVSPYFIKDPLYADAVSIAHANNSYKTMAVLPISVTMNTRYPGAGRAEKNEALIQNHPEKWMQFYHDFFQRHADELYVTVQPPEQTLALLRQAGISKDSLQYVSRQRLMDILQVDALLMQDFDINIYTTKGQDVATSTGALLLIAGAAATGGAPRGGNVSSSVNSVHFIKVYGKGVETPIWSFYGPNTYDIKNAPTLPDKTSMDFYRHMKFPFLKENELKKRRPKKSKT